MNQQIASRISGENRAERVMLQLLCAVSFWRTAATRILPLYGTSGWWIALACLLPGFAVALLLRWAMALTGASNVTEAVRVCLGRAGAAAFSVLLALLLAVEGVSALTALLTVFTQGVGTRGTQFTLAVLTGAVMLFALHREGLPRAVYLLRWVMTAAALAVAAFALCEAKLDHLFPLHGAEDQSSLSGFLAAPGLAWPVTLLLTLPPGEKRGRICSGILPAAAAVSALIITTLTVPHELLLRRTTLADALLLPAWFAPNALRVIWLCLLMLTFFLSVAASLQLATRHLCAPFSSVPEWLPHVLLAGVVLTQLIDPQYLWQLLVCVEPWLLLPLLAAAVIILPIAFIRRKCA